MRSTFEDASARSRSARPRVARAALAGEAEELLELVRGGVRVRVVRIRRVVVDDRDLAVARALLDRLDPGRRISANLYRRLGDALHGRRDLRLRASLVLPSGHDVREAAEDLTPGGTREREDNDGTVIPFDDDASENALHTHRVTPIVEYRSFVGVALF